VRGREKKGMGERIASGFALAMTTGRYGFFATLRMTGKRD
jgi:hypothetical protein